MKLKSKIKITQLRNWINFLPAIILSFFLSSSFAGQAVKPLAAKIVLPKIVIASLEKNQIPLDAVSVSIIKINDKNINAIQALPYLNWRATEAMNPASTMKVLTTISALDLLGPQYQWRTNLFTDGPIDKGVLKGNIYLQGTGDPKLVPEELEKLMKQLQSLGIQKIDGNLIFDRSAYATSVMGANTIDGEPSRSYNAAPDALLYSFKTLSFQISKTKHADLVDISVTPALAGFRIQNDLGLSNYPCDNWKKNLYFDIFPDFTQTKNGPPSLVAKFSGYFPTSCGSVTYNVVTLDPDTLLTKGFTAAWELAGGAWSNQPTGTDGLVPVSARLLLSFNGSRLDNDVQDINKFSNNVMARQLFLTLGLEKIGKPATTSNSEIVVKAWLKEQNLDFPELILENGSGLSRNEAISAQHLNELLVTARKLPTSDIFFNSLPIAGADGTMKNRLINQLRKLLHIKKKPEVRMKTGSLAEVKSISGYVISKSGNLYAVTSFINHPNAWKGAEAHDQLLAWVLEDGPEPKQAR